MLQTWANRLRMPVDKVRLIRLLTRICGLDTGPAPVPTASTPGILLAAVAHAQRANAPAGPQFANETLQSPQRAPQKHSPRVVSARHTGRGEGTYSAPEITTGDAVLHGQAVLTVGDGSPVGNREDARGRREDGKKLRKTQTMISWSFLTTICGPAGSPASAFTRQGAHCTAAVDRAISVN